MTDAEFDRWCLALDKACAADTRGTTKIGRLYKTEPTPNILQQDYSADIAQVRLNGELYGDNN